jgi:hypothetical protein
MAVMDVVAEYEAPAGKLWICQACGRASRRRDNLGDTSCFMWAVLMSEDAARKVATSVRE